MIILASVLQVDFVNQEMVDLLKNIPDMTWTPGIPAIFAGKSEEEVFMMIGDTNINFQHDLEPDLLEKEAAMETQELLEKAVLPDSFSWFDLKPECMRVRHITLYNESTGIMKTCPAYWAFASVGVFGDNRCILGRDPVRVNYSEQYRISCDNYAIDKIYSHCITGSNNYYHWFMTGNGLPTEACISYKGEYHNNYTKICPTECDDGSAIVTTTLGINKYYDGFLYKPNDISKEDLMKQYMMKFGSLLGSFDVYYDYLFYQNGIYQHKTGSLQYNQPVIIVGWGIENGVKYWLCRQNWGELWGESGDQDPENYDQLGYFRILRGVNHCNIEETCYIYEV
ncbi:Cathepsin_B [Hexamita inflata]|uniref:Cathepsin_B n=1 Tax=Hexamita inflata TaxID=28002 RepID=A0ABP1KTM7_9EUKA